jgi:hypothetical protein
MQSTNPRDVGQIFCEYARKIHSKAVPTDPNFLQISVACGKVNILLFLLKFHKLILVLIPDWTVVRTKLPLFHTTTQHEG